MNSRPTFRLICIAGVLNLSAIVFYLASRIYTPYEQKRNDDNIHSSNAYHHHNNIVANLQSTGSSLRTNRRPLKDVGGPSRTLVEHGLDTMTSFSRPRRGPSTDQVVVERKMERGFPGTKIPSQLLHWRPSPQSHAYFQPIDGKEAWLYSAFYDRHADGPVAVIRAFGLFHALLPRLVFCHYLDANASLIESQQGAIVPIRDKPYYLYLGTSVVCPIDNINIIDNKLRPRYVAVTFTQSYHRPTNQLSIQYPPLPGNSVRNFTVCYSPLHSTYNWPFQLIQSVELNRLLGATHFVVYNFSISPETDAVLRHYEGRGLLTVRQWPLPVLGSWYYGQLEAINDCIYSNKMTSRFVALVDTDEFIVPTKRSDWWGMIDDVIQSPNQLLEKDSQMARKEISPETSQEFFVSDIMTASTSTSRNGSMPIPYKSAQERIGPSYFGGFSFRSVLYPGCTSSEPTAYLHQLQRLNYTARQLHYLSRFPSCSLVQLKHNNVFWGHETRSKLIVRPEAVLHGSVHKTIRYHKPYTVAYVSIQAASLHHYRLLYGNSKCKAVDLSVLRFKDRLVDRLRAMTSRFPSIFPEDD